MIFPFDHNPPHVHAFGPDFRVKLAIADGRVIEAQGVVGPAVMRRLQAWMTRNRERLAQLWADAARGNPLGKVEE
jgi:Domain of unknown function (DUF4160)